MTTDRALMTRQICERSDAAVKERCNAQNMNYVLSTLVAKHISRPRHLFFFFGTDVSFDAPDFRFFGT